MSSEYAFLGVIVVANLATIVAMWIFSIKIAVEFGTIKTKVGRNSNDITRFAEILSGVNCKKVNTKIMETQ